MWGRGLVKPSNTGFKLGALGIGAILLFVILAALYSSVIGAGRTKAVNDYLEQALEHNAEEIAKHREASEDNQKLISEHRHKVDEWKQKAEGYRERLAIKNAMHRKEQEAHDETKKSLEEADSITDRLKEQLTDFIADDLEGECPVDCRIPEFKDL